MAVTFPNAKINLGLYITGKRDDGYHNIESLFLPIHCKDALEVLPAEEANLTIHNKAIPGNVADNLCWKAYQILQQDFDLPPVAMHLLKNIPMGAGLGGGSADGAFALKLLEEQFELNLNTKQLENYAAQLGSDCIFFIQNQTAHVTGRGEVVKPIKPLFSGYPIIVVYPQFHMSTAQAYKQVSHSTPKNNLAEVTEQAIINGQIELTNAFQVPFLNAFPPGHEILQQLKQAGAFYTSLSGSGSSFYGIVQPEKLNINSIQEFCAVNNYQLFSTYIL